MAIDLTIILKDQVSSAAEKMAASIQKIDSAIEKVAEKGARSMEELGESADKAGSDLVDLANKSDSASDAVGTKVVNASGRAQSAFGKMGSKAESVAGTIKSKFDSMANGVSSMVGKLWNKFGALTGFSIGDSIFKKGFERLETIDTAKAKLKGLEFSVKEIDSVMDSANKSVKGTAFGLGDAVDIAAGAAATGLIKTGDEMTQYLKDVSDAAAIANVPMDEMGQIFNKITSSGKLTGETIQQLAERNVPVWSLLQKATHKSMDQVRADVSAGKVTIEDLQKAIEGSSIAGAAGDMAKNSFAGAKANVEAALGRLGAALLDGEGNGGGMFGQLRPLMEGFINNIDKITEKAKPIGEVLGAVFKGLIEGGKIFFGVVKKILTPIGKLIGGLSKAAGHGDKMKGLADTIAAIAPAIFTVITALLIYKGVMTVINAVQKIMAMTNPFMLIAMAVMAVIVILIALQKKFKIFNKLGKIFKNIGKAMIAPFVLVFKFFKNIGGWFKDKFGKAKEAIKGNIDKIKNKFGEFKDKAKEFLQNKFGPIAEGAKKIARSKLGKGVTAAAKAMWKGIKFYMFAARHPIQALKKVIKGFRDFFKKVGGAIKDSLSGIKDKFEGVFDKIKGFISPVIDKFTELFDAIGKIPGALKKLPGKAAEKAEELFGEGGENLDFYASGTNYASGGLSIVGENGPELVNLPKGTKVKTASTTRQILSGASRNADSGNVSNKNLHIAKFADSIVIREEADIDKLTMKIARLMGEEDYNMA